MAAIEVKMTEDNVDLVKNATAEAVARTLEAIGLTAEGHAKLKCPVDTGRLRNSITHVVDDDTVYIGTNVEYAAYVELGTIHTRAQPYLRPAASGHTSEYRALAEKYLRNA